MHARSGEPIQFNQARTETDTDPDYTQIASISKHSLKLTPLVLMFFLKIFHNRVFYSSSSRNQHFALFDHASTLLCGCILAVINTVAAVAITGARNKYLELTPATPRRTTFHVSSGLSPASVSYFLYCPNTNHILLPPAPLHGLERQLF